MTTAEKKRVVRLADLDADTRRLILALIDGQRESCARGHHVMEDGRCKYATAHKAEEKQT